MAMWTAQSRRVTPALVHRIGIAVYSRLALTQWILSCLARPNSESGAAGVMAGEICMGSMTQFTRRD